MMKKINDVSVLNPTGEINPADGGLLLQRIQALMAKNFSKIVLDLGDVDHMHYRFIAELTALAQVSSVMAGGIKLANVTSYNRDIIRLIGVERFLETYDSVAEAILSFPSGILNHRDACVIH